MNRKVLRLGKAILLFILVGLVAGCSPYACPSYETYSYGTNRPNYAALRKKQSRKPGKSPKPVKRAEQ